MSRQIARLFAWVALVVSMSGASLGMPANSAHADDCRPAPNSPAPAGTHWYYRLEWATQRKCWYVRAPGRHTHQATAPAKVVPIMSAPSDPTPVADAPSPMSPGPGDITPLSAPARTSILKAVSAPAPGATIDKPPQQSAQEESATPIVEAPPPQAGASLEAGVQTSASRTAAPAEPAIAVTSAKTQESAATPPRARADGPSDEAEYSARSGGPINNGATNNSATPIIIFPILALGLALLGIGSRLLVKHAAARGAQSIVDEHQFDRVSDDGRREGRDIPDRPALVIGPELNSLISAVSDQGTFRGDGDAVRVTREISKRRYKLAHLRQHIERMLRSAVGPYAESLQEQT
jgi:hypothetical protein